MIVIVPIRSAGELKLIDLFPLHTPTQRAFRHSNPRPLFPMNNNRSRKARKTKPKAMSNKTSRNIPSRDGRHPSDASSLSGMTPGLGIEGGILQGRSVPDLLDAEFKKMTESDLMFGHTAQFLPLIDMEDESFTNWYRKNAGMHTVEVRI